MERETDKYRCTVYNWNTVKYNIIRGQRRREIWQ